MTNRRPTIMVIDDVELVLDNVSHMAKTYGLQCVTIRDTSMFSAEWASSSIDLVLTDIFMPGKSGLDIIEEVKSSQPQVPVMAMSAGWEGDSDREEALQAAKKLGACDTVLRKPFTLREFGSAMREAGLIP